MEFTLDLKNFISAYFRSSLNVTFCLILLKIFGITTNSWIWTTVLLWAPLGFALVLLGSFLVLSYVGFLFGFTGEYLKRILHI